MLIQEPNDSANLAAFVASVDIAFFGWKGNKHLEPIKSTQH